MWASPVVQMVKNLLAMQNIRVHFLGWDDPMEQETVTRSSILAWKSPWTEEPGVAESDTTEQEAAPQ